MKYPFFVKSALIVGSALALMNCGDEAANIANQIPNADAIGQISSDSSNGVVVNEACWVLDADKTYLINTNFIVTDANGAPIGTYDPATQTIKDAAGTPIVNSVDLNALPVKAEGETIVPVNPPSVGLSSASIGGVNTTPTTPITGLSSAVATPALSSAVTTTTSSPSAQPGVSSANVEQPKSSNSQQQPKSSSSQQQQQQQGGNDGTCFDKASNKNVKPYENLNVNGASYAYKEDCTINCYYDPQGKNCASLGSSTGSNNNQQQASSSSQQQQQQAKSSSSQQQPKSSSSQGTTGGSTGGTISSNYTIKYIAGGKSGSGYATRYWDCCEPHCAWPEHGGKASTCDAKGNKVAGGSQSMCDGGNAGICRNQFPIVVNEKLAFAFAATPGGENNCGKCFDLAFTGKGKYATDNHSKLVGKHLIVMSSNVGYDVAGGQFDVMIPGGGFGIFDGCSAKMGWGSQGSQYGGLLDECEKETGYAAAKYKSCLTEKCNRSFSMDPQAKEGCLFMANWMEAAGNPLLEYKEVECPQELISRF
ncbi:MAG: glycosyl hydrolase family 5 [Fibrobacter sp.]|nr:glycosyl hydrolase family 5 [Fibrobacter sp.]